MNIAPAKITFSEADRAVILKRIDECLASGQLTLGNYGRQLEEYLAQYIGVDHAVTVNSGTSALEIPLRILDVAGGEVILPAIEGFTPLAQQLQSALDNYAADLSSGNRDAARTAWASAMAAFSRIEVMQLGPAAADSQMGGENLRDLIYFWPSRNECLIDNAAYSNSAVIGMRTMRTS